MTVDDLLSGKDAGQNEVVIGGGLVGCETVYLLALAGKLYGASKYRKMLPKGAEQQLIRLLIDKKLPSSLRKNIRIIEPSEDVADGIERGTKQAIFEGFSKWGVQVNTGLLLDEVVDGGIVTIDRYGMKHNFDCDNVVLTSFAPDDALLEGFEKVNIPVYPVGDCVSPRKIYDAIHEGFLAGYHV
jgi:2,4-dienoyl-CoA reductase (NADPH2)